MVSGSESSSVPTRGEMDGTKPVTDRGSKMVMLRAERGDRIQISEVVRAFQDHPNIPRGFAVQQRTSTFYGTELQLSPSEADRSESYLLTAPGPDAYLHLWAAITDSSGYRESWAVVAEVRAGFADDLPQYSICPNCGEPIKSLEHERLAVIDRCPV